MLANWLLALAAVSPQGPQDLVLHWQQRLEALAQSDDRHGTFGPTGRRVWATRLESAPGFRGDFHYLQHTPGLVDPLVVELTDGKGVALPMSVVAQEWRPSHGTVRYAVGEGGEAVAERWITDDDVLVARFSVRGVPQFGLRWESPLADDPAGDLGRFAAISLSGLANEDLLRSAVLRSGGAASPIYIEAEDHVRQVGSTGMDRKAAASGGLVLGRDFGAVKGHEASYAFVGTGAEHWTLVARYARALPGDAVFAVSLRGERIGVLRCVSTGGWGNAGDDFAYQSVELGEIPDRQVELTITAEADGANTNFDGFFVMPTGAGMPLPPQESWSGLDPMRGAIRLPGGRLVVEGVPFAFLPPMGPQGVYRQAEPIPVPGQGSRLHVLAVPVGPEARVECDGEIRRLGARRRDLRRNMVSLEVAADREVQLVTRDCVVLAVTREKVGSSTTSHVRRGHRVLHGVATEVRVGLHGLARPWNVASAGDSGARFHFTVEFTGDGVPGAATEMALAGDDTLAWHRRRYASWYAANAPRLTSSDELLERLWTYRWFLVRHNLAAPGAGFLRGGPVIYEGRHGSWYPRVITFSTPHIIAEARWLADPGLFLGNVTALIGAQAENGVFPNLLVDWAGFRYINWIPQAVVEAFKVRPDRRALQRVLPALIRNVEGAALAFDKDGDGLLAPGDHYTTGMEFQPSFWALDGYDNSKPQTELERPDFNAYHYANTTALAEAARFLGREGEAEKMLRVAERTRDAVLAKLWHGEDRFFYSIRESDDVPARCKEVIGFYPFRFGLVPAKEPYPTALQALIDPEEFWTGFPVATCSVQVPVYSAQVQRWPGPGGVTAACMWNGPTWPHANSLVADAMAAALRSGAPGALRPGHLGTFLRRFAAFHCENGDPKKLLLREYGDAETGVNWGCPDYMHSTFNDLIIRHAAGLVPRFDDVLEVRPLDLGLGDLSIEDIPYHGHDVGIAITGNRVRVTLDGEFLGEGSVTDGLHLTGFLK